jgi:hypothetical protein
VDLFQKHLKNIKNSPTKPFKPGNPIDENIAIINKIPKAGIIFIKPPAFSIFLLLSLFSRNATIRNKAPVERA